MSAMSVGVGGGGVDMSVDVLPIDRYLYMKVAYVILIVYVISDDFL